MQACCEHGSQYLCTGGILKCDGESAAAAALCQNVLARPCLEKHPTIDCCHKHIPHH